MRGKQRKEGAPVCHGDSVPEWDFRKGIEEDRVDVLRSVAILMLEGREGVSEDGFPLFVLGGGRKDIVLNRETRKDTQNKQTGVTRKRGERIKFEGVIQSHIDTSMSYRV